MKDTLRSRHRWWRALVLACGLFWAMGLPGALAQQTPPGQQPPGQQTPPTAFQLQQFRPSLDPNGFIQTQSADSLGQWSFLVGLSLNYAWSPLFLVADGSAGQQIGLVDHQIGLDIALGVGILPFLDVVAMMPVTLYQIGQFPALDILGTAAQTPLTGTFAGDLKIRGKLQTLNTRDHGVSLGFLVTLGIPSGDKLTFNGEDTISFAIGASLSRAFSRFEFGINFGYRYLPETSFLGLVIGHELYYNAGFSVAVLPRFFEIIGEVNGLIGLSGGEDRTNSPMALLAGGRLFPLRNRVVALQFGVGIGILKGYGSPGFRGFLSLVWYPTAGRRTRDPISDRDGDGIEDAVDRCPAQKGPKSNNGCPLSDMDKDGVPDKQDRCPQKAGPASNGGCPPKSGGVKDSDGDGIPDHQDRCPRAAGPRSTQGCPVRKTAGDRDGDGVPDSRDRCPGVAGPASNNGCPLPDSDGDGIPDRDDRCPRKAGPRNNQGCPLGMIVSRRRTPPGRRVARLSRRDRDGDGIIDRLDRCPGLPGSRKRRGCPRKVLIKMVARKRRIYLRRRVRFYRGRLRRSTKSIFRQVARLMKSFPTMRIRIIATTYSRSRRRWVRRRSWLRARRIRNYLRRLGIHRKRISISGRRRYRRRRYTTTRYRITIRRF